MRRKMGFVLGGLVASGLFAVVVYLVLVTAHVSEPAASTVQGLTARRLWATMAAVLALVGAVGGGLALRHSERGFGGISPRMGAILAVTAGPTAAINGGLNLAFAHGGPGTGNGVVGGAAAVVLGLVAAVLGGVAFARGRSTLRAPEQMT